MGGIGGGRGGMGSFGKGGAAITEQQHFVLGGGAGIGRRQFRTDERDDVERGASTELSRENSQASSI